MTHPLSFDLDEYVLRNGQNLLTPALCIYPEVIDNNIRAALGLMAGDPNRWRPHVKTAKLAFTIRRYLHFGIRQFKCANTLELKMLCELGAEDVLLAQPIAGAAASRVREIAATFPAVRISVLVESDDHLLQWYRSGIGVYLDVNPGMDRTGVPAIERTRIVEIAVRASGRGQDFRGIHFYDGHLGHLPFEERGRAANANYADLIETIESLRAAGISPGELITSGTPTFPAALRYAAFAGQEFTHRVSPGTIIYGDRRSLSQLPFEFGFAPAVLVLSTVVSHPSESIATCDAGSKSVSADAGAPTCEAFGHAGLIPMKPSEEHLPFRADSELPPIGSLLYLVPTHVCTTVNNFDYCWLCKQGEAGERAPVTARGHESLCIRG